MKRIIKSLARLVNLAALVGLVLAYLAPYVDPVDFWPISFFGLSYKVWFLINIALLIFWVITRSSLWKYNLTFLLLGAGFVARNVQYNKQDNTASNLKVCTFNTNVQKVYDDGNTSEQINEHLVSEKYDVAVLIEWLNKKGAIDQEAFPHQQFVRLNSKQNRYDYGLKMVSKHKILDWEKIKYNHFTNNMAAYFDVDVDGTVIRFLAVHLQSNSLSSQVYHRLVNVEIDEEYKEYAFNFMRRLRVVFERRSEQTKTVLEAIKESPYPVVVMGDFNDTPQSFTYQQLKTGRKDAFIEKGNGWGATFLKPFPLLRIDYILHDEELKCKSYECISDIKSDHALVAASFEIME